MVNLCSGRRAGARSLGQKLSAARCRSIDTLWPLLGKALQSFSPDYDSGAIDSRAALGVLHAAVIDRIVHHATLLTTNGDSYRLKAAQRNQTAHARQKKTR